MSISLAEYREIIGGRTTLAEIEARRGRCAASMVKARKPIPFPMGPTGCGGVSFPAGAAVEIDRKVVAECAPQVSQNVLPADGGEIVLELPYPPSMNHYWRHWQGRVLISKDGRAYRREVELLVAGRGRVDGRVRMSADVYPPDLRRRDLDNLLKSMQDALVHGGALRDDSDIKVLHMEMHEPLRPAGKVVVRLSRISGCV